MKPKRPFVVHHYNGEFWRTTTFSTLEKAIITTKKKEFLNQYAYAKIFKNDIELARILSDKK
ncbi:MAG: hypothetical protein KGJ13_04950 [Patescibacteria group bacterium]|nr:hypothetical protein [Patescibacteria group bacterium]